MPEKRDPDDRPESDSLNESDPDFGSSKQSSPSPKLPREGEDSVEDDTVENNAMGDGAIGDGAIGDDDHAETTLLFGELSTNQRLSTKSFRDLMQFLESGEHPTIPEPSIELLGRFVDLEVVGEGSFGVVLRGFDSVLERAVAIKVLRAAEDDEFERRFLSEARRMAQLDHPGICRVHDFGAIDGRSYIVTEWIEGTTIADIETPLAWERACTLIAELADAMAHAHAAEVIHRDLKPANIMIDDRGRVRVIDFGLAIGSEDQLTSQIEYSGSPASMAPEQIKGRVDLLDARVDIWAMGIVLYELLTGKRPFRGANRLDLTEKILHKPVPPPRTFDASIPGELEAIVLHTLAKEPDERIPTATELAERLQAVLANVAPATETASPGPFESGPPESDRIGRAEKEHVAAPASGRPKRLGRLVAWCGLITIVTGIGLWAITNGIMNRFSREVTVPDTDQASLTDDPPLNAANALAPSPDRFAVLLRRPTSGLEWAIDGSGSTGFGVEDGDEISLVVELDKPRHVYLVWIGTDTGLTHLYPGPLGTSNGIGNEQVDRPVRRFELEVGQINRTPSTETALMIVLSEPLQDANELRQRLHELPIPNLTLVLPSGSFRGVHFNTSGRLTHLESSDANLPPGVREAVQETVDYLRSEFGSSATIQAVSFASGNTPEDIR